VVEAGHLLVKPKKGVILHKLRMSFDELRKLKPRKGYYSLSKRPLLDNIFWTNDTVDSIGGPFDTETPLNDAMLKKYIFNHLPRRKSDIYKRAFPSLLHEHPPVLSHGDFPRKKHSVAKTVSLR
jgi:hypothetical protein